MGLSEVGVDAVGVGGGELGEGLLPVVGDLSLDEAALGLSLVRGSAVSLALSAARRSSMLQIASHNSLMAATGLLGVFRTLLVWCFRLPWLGPGILARSR